MKTPNIKLELDKLVTRDMLPLPGPVPEGYVEPKREPFDLANMEIDAAGYFVRPKKEPVVKEHPVVLALDLSVAGTGYAVSDLDGVTAGVQKFTVTSKEHEALRFQKFYRWFETMLQVHQPDVVVFEDAPLRGKGSYGAIRCAVALSSRVEELCAVKGIPTKQCTPNAIKKAFLGDAKADPEKKRITAHAAAMFPEYDPSKDKGANECDARAIDWCYRNKPEIFEPKVKEKPVKVAA